MKRHVRRAAWILVVLLIVGVVVWTGANLVGSWRYQSALAELEADGFATQIHAIAPAAVPASENAAPYYGAAFALYVAPPEAADWETKPTRELNPDERAATDAWLARNAEAFDLVRRAQKRPRCQFERDYSLGFSMPLPEVSKALGLTRALHRLAETQLLAGDGAAARESVKLMFALGECFRDDAILVSHLVRMTAAEIALRAVDDAVTDAAGEADLRAWLAALPAEGFLNGSLERAFRGEIALSSSLFSRPQEEVVQLLGMSGWTRWTLMSPLIRFDAADYLRDMRRIVLASRKPHLEAVADLAGVERNSSYFWRPFRAYFMPALTRSFDRAAAVEARLIVLRAGLDAELVRRTTGSYPKDVRGVDPFSGKPLVYDREKGRIASIRPTDGFQDRPTEWRLRVTK